MRIVVAVYGPQKGATPAEVAQLLAGADLVITGEGSLYAPRRPGCSAIPVR